MSSVETDVDAYFAQHDVPSVVSDMLFELGFNRPKDVGKFIANYIDRRFQLEGTCGGDSNVGGAQGAADGNLSRDEGFATIEIRTPQAAFAEGAGGAEVVACALLEEARALRKKYKNFEPKPYAGHEEDPHSAEATFAMIPWAEFRQDYERLLLILASPQLWSFCERRLAQLRGLFDAHAALNAVLEEADLGAESPPAVDGCVQLARALSPSRLRAFFAQKMAAGELTQEVAPGRKLGDLTAQLGRQPAASDLTVDADVHVPAAGSLAGVFSRTSNHTRGRFLAESAKMSLDLLEVTDTGSGGQTYAEYRLPLHAESGAWVDLARWVAEFGVSSPRCRWVVQLPQNSFSGLKDRRSVLSFGELLDNVFGPPAASAATKGTELEESAEAEALSAFLETVSGIEVAAVAGAVPDALDDEADREPKEWMSSASPPFGYQLYHVWGRLQALNACRKVAGLPSLGLRCAANNAEPLACAYLLGAVTCSRCGALPSHAPLQYLFALDGVGVTVSMISKRSLGGASMSGAQAFAKLFKAGVRVSLCTEDNTESQHSDAPLAAELGLARHALDFSSVDLAEVARTSVDISGFAHLKRRPQYESGDRSSADDLVESGEPGSPMIPIRERYRHSRRATEIWLIGRLARGASEPSSRGGALGGESGAT